MNRTPIPKHVIAEAWPGKPPAQYILRTRNPFLVGHLESAGPSADWRLHLLTPGELQALPELKKQKTLRRLVDHGAAELGASAPDQPYSLTLADAPVIPEWLVCDNTRAQFTGVLHVTSPRFWLVIHADNEGGDFVPVDTIPEDQAAVWIGAAIDYYRNYCAAEDAL